MADLSDILRSSAISDRSSAIPVGTRRTPLKHRKSTRLSKGRLPMPENMASPPSPEEYAPHHASYIARVPEGDIVETLGLQIGETLQLLRAVTEAEADLRQPPYTWSFKEVVGHLADTERILAGRAVRIPRGHQ